MYGGESLRETDPKTTIGEHIFKWQRWQEIVA